MCTPASRIGRRLDLFAAGLSRRDIDRGLVAGSLIRLRRGIYADAAVCASRRRAALHGGAPACVSAARHAGLWVLAAEEPDHVGLRPDGHGHAHDGCACVAHWDNTDADRFALPPIRVILRQILLCRGVEEFFVTLESALHRRAIGSSGLAWLARNTSAAAREALAFATSDAESGLESLVRWRLRHLDVEVRTQASLVSIGRVDLLIGDRLIVEVDGLENHADVEHRHRDLVRDANAAAWGFVTLRFDYALVVHDWETVELAVRAHIGRGIHRR